MDILEIKEIGIADIEQLQIIGKKTFSETFVEKNRESMQKYMEVGFTFEKLTRELKSLSSNF